jgi:hypothetical protein
LDIDQTLTHPNNRIKKLSIISDALNMRLLRDALMDPNCKLVKLNIYKFAYSLRFINFVFAGVFSTPHSRLEEVHINTSANPTDVIKSLDDGIGSNVVFQRLMLNGSFTPVGRNIAIQNVVTQSARTLIAIRKFCQADSGLLGLVPKEIVHLIAEYLISTYRESVWLGVVPKN